MFHIIKQATGFKQYGQEKWSVCCGKASNNAMPWRRWSSYCEEVCAFVYRPFYLLCFQVLDNIT